MIVNYCDILKQQQKYSLQAISTTFFSRLIGNNCSWDVHNTVVVNDVKQNSPELRLIKIETNGDIIKRKVIVVGQHFTNGCVALISEGLAHNLGNPVTCTFGKCHQKTLMFAEEVQISLISTPHEWTNFIVDRCLENYFKKPKLLYKGDIITVNIKDYGKEVFYLVNKMSNVNQNLYFKCNKVIYMNKSVTDGYLCASNKSRLKQTTNIQAYIPRKCQESTVLNSPLLYPDAFGTHFKNIKKAIHPFTNKVKPNFLPVFLLEGAKGSGKSLLVQSVAADLGMHLYTINNFDVTANVYVQNETKLRNFFFGAKMAAPSILEIKNFENFGKNVEGEYDERLIGNFINEVKNLFVGNAFPLILFCCSNDKNIPINLRRIFLKNFEMKTPSTEEREKILQWILTDKNIKTDLDIHTLASKSHGFLFEDLKALIDHAVNDFRRENTDVHMISNHYFFKALDFMQLNYNEGLGAPKVPKVKWSDVGGLDDVKEEIIKTIKLPLKHPELLKCNGLKRSGILLYGPPGTGKTLLAKAVATECGLCFLSVKGPELLNMYVGQSEKNIREVFERAREASPCIIFFDELDSLAPNRGASGDSGGVMDRVVSQLLAEMDGLNQTGTVFIIGATNRPDLIDPALLRPGRFDKLLYVGPCMDRDSKLEVLKALTRKFHLANNLLLEEIVTWCPNNFSGADFYGMCSGAWMSAVRRLIKNVDNGHANYEGNLLTPKDVVVTDDDFKFAIKNIKPSLKQQDLDYFHKLRAEM